MAEANSFTVHLTGIPTDNMSDFTDTVKAIAAGKIAIFEVSPNFSYC